MAKMNDNLLRLSPDVAAILGNVAEERHFSEAMVVEMLITKEALERGILGADHPEAAFWSLINLVEGWAIPAQEDFTLRVFERIASTPEALRLWEQTTAENRKKGVNQKIGRFCKSLIGWESAEEIQLGRGSVGLIKSYTRLKPSATAGSAQHDRIT
jgi:hypothetical protein